MPKIPGCGRGTGLRKAILVNEHFVVYGAPGIAVPLRLPVEVSMTLGPGRGIEIVVFSADGQTRAESQDPDLHEATRRILAWCDVCPEERAVRLECRGSLPGWSGLGSSAAFCVATTRACAEANGISLTDERINEISYEAEKVFANNPSGIDNTVAAFGRVVWFVRGSTPPWTFLDPRCPLWLVVVNSGRPSRTRDQVQKVARFRESHAQRFDALCREATDLAGLVREALASPEPTELGPLLDRNHEMLREIGASDPDLDRLVSLCRAKGSAGAKLTGAGGGGCVIALARDQREASFLAAAIGREGFGAFAACGVEHVGGSRGLSTAPDERPDNLT